MFFLIFLSIIILIVVIGTVYSRTKAGPHRQYNINLNRKVAIITGSSGGIGKETARKFAARGATVIFACRNKEKTQPIIEEMKKQTANKELYFMHLDLPDYESVRQFVKEFKSQFKQCDYLINNAGIFLIKEQKNDQQHELTFATNHLGHFLLTNLLLDAMSEKSRIINVASGAHEFKRSVPNFELAINGGIGTGMNAYATSKFANIVFTQGLQQKLDQQNRNIKVLSVHPGFVRSEIYHGKHGENPILVLFARSIIWLMSQFSLDEEQGARTTEYTAFMPYEELVPAGYYEKIQLSKSSKLVRECGLEQQLWDLSVNAVKI